MGEETQRRRNRSVKRASGSDGCGNVGVATKGRGQQEKRAAGQREHRNRASGQMGGKERQTGRRTGAQTRRKMQWRDDKSQRKNKEGRTEAKGTRIQDKSRRQE